MRYNNTECSICHKGLYHKPHELKRWRTVCCKDCKSKAYKLNTSIWKTNFSKGSGWNKGKSKLNGDVLSYGKPRSEETKQLISKRLKQVLVKKGIMRNCLICSKTVYVFPTNIKRNFGYYCSRRCATISNNLKRKTSDTDIEIAMEEWLKQNNIIYEKQKAIEGVTICDFFIQPNILLYCDGDYWHNLSKVKIRDQWINKQLLNKGYSVIRISGSDIKHGIRPIQLLL